MKVLGGETVEIDLDLICDCGCQNNDKGQGSILCKTNISTRFFEIFSEFFKNSQKCDILTLPEVT